MTDCRFWGGYLLGIVTVLALGLFDSFSHTWRIGVLVVAALAGFGLLLARSRQLQRNVGRNKAGLEGAGQAFISSLPAVGRRSNC